MSLSSVLADIRVWAEYQDSKDQLIPISKPLFGKCMLRRRVYIPFQLLFFISGDFKGHLRNKAFLS